MAVFLIRLPYIPAIDGRLIWNFTPMSFSLSLIHISLGPTQTLFFRQGTSLYGNCRTVENRNPNTGSYDRGKVHICKGAYLGMNNLVVKPVTIGERAIIGAGSVVTKDIPANEVWAGNQMCIRDSHYRAVKR